MRINRTSTRPSRPQLPDSDSSSSWIEAHGQMRGERVFFVLRRELAMSDVNPSKNRVLLNKKGIEEALVPVMTKNEVSLLNDQSQGLPVVAIDLAGQQYGLVIKQLDNSNQYGLGKEWSEIVKKNKLKEGDSIYIWAFRRRDNEELCLIIEPL